MGKGLLNKLKLGLAGLGLIGFSYFNSLNNLQAQTTANYQAIDKDVYEYEFYSQKQESLYMNYYGIEKDIQRRYKQKRDSIFDIYQNYYKKKIGVEDKDNSLEFFLPDSLLDSFRKKVDSLDSVFNPEKENLYNNYKQKKDSITIQYNQKIYKDYQGPKEDSILENMLKDFLGEYRIDTIYLEKLHRDGSMTDTFRVYKTLINYFEYDPLYGDEYDQSQAAHIWLNKEMAKWLQSLGEEKRDSLKKSILKERKKIDWQDLEYARQELDPNYPPNKPVNIPGTGLYLFNSAWMFKKDEQEDTLIMEKYEDKIIWKNKNKKVVTPISK